MSLHNQEVALAIIFLLCFSGFAIIGFTMYSRDGLHGNEPQRLADFKA